MEAFGWAYIGNGNIAASTARDILRGSHKIISVYGRNAKKAQAFAQRVGARSFASAKEALTCPGVQGAYIATPHTSHLEYALSAMQLGVPVLCEKPVAVCEADVRRLIDASRQYDVYFCEAMWTWFSDVALTVKKWVQGVLRQNGLSNGIFARRARDNGRQKAVGLYSFFRNPQLYAHYGRMPPADGARLSV